MGWFDLSGDWLASFTNWFNTLVAWVTVNSPQLLASLPWPRSGGTPGTVLPGPSVAATPELDSFVLFAAGLTGAGSYALTRIRARRKT